MHFADVFILSAISIDLPPLLWPLFLAASPFRVYSMFLYACLRLLHGTSLSLKMRC